MQDPHSVIDNLTLADAQAILRTLADSDAVMALRIVELAVASAEEVDPDEVADALYDELDALPVEEVWDRAGATRRGYVDPADAADQMIEDVLTPYLQELARYQRLGLDAAARKQCMGVRSGCDAGRHVTACVRGEQRWAIAAGTAVQSAAVDQGGGLKVLAASGGPGANMRESPFPSYNTTRIQTLNRPIRTTPRRPAVEARSPSHGRLRPPCPHLHGPFLRP